MLEILHNTKRKWKLLAFGSKALYNPTHRFINISWSSWMAMFSKTHNFKHLRISIQSRESKNLYAGPKEFIKWIFLAIRSWNFCIIRHIYYESLSIQTCTTQVLRLSVELVHKHISITLLWKQLQYESLNQGSRL